MDLLTGAFAVIGTLVVVIPILYAARGSIEKRFLAKLSASEASCRGDLSIERVAREESDRRLHELESTVRSLLTNELTKTTHAIVFVAEKMGDMVESLDEMRGELRMRSRAKDRNSQTTVMLKALKAPKGSK